MSGPDVTDTALLSRCGWARNAVMITYHDTEWGVPVHDDQRHFEFLTLEGAQAGLTWEMILRRRDAYRRAFVDYDVERLAMFSDDNEKELLQDAGIVRNRLKIHSVVTNAQAFLNVQRECGSFDAYIWQFVEGHTQVNQWTTLDQIPARTPQSDTISKDLQKRGFRFVGSTIIYAYMQATGLVNDHLVQCFRHHQVSIDPT